MERFDRRLHVRVSAADIERTQTLAGALNITTSALVRLLLQLPAEDVAARRYVALDLGCANRLYRELNQWGYQQNQAAHALNRIAYYLRRETMDASDVLEELSSVERQLERLRERAATPGWRTSAPASAWRAPSRGTKTSSKGSSRAWA